MEKEKIKITDDTNVVVRSCFSGKLYFKNLKTGDETEWSRLGDEQELTVADLKSMRSTQSAFFKNQWVRIVCGYDDSGNEIPAINIINYLRLQQYYQNFIDPSDKSVVCGWSIKEIEENVPLMSDNAKDNLMVALNDYIDSGMLDSVSKIRAFEKALGRRLGEE